MNRKVPTETKPQEAWSKTLSMLLARHNYAQTFRLLDKIIEDDLPLFSGNKKELEGRRITSHTPIAYMPKDGSLAPLENLWVDQVE